MGKSAWVDVRVGNHRFGFNGKEKDQNQEWGELTHYDYGFRIYNPGIARFLSVDPLTRNYPWYTPYQFAGNNPIKFIDLDGLEPAVPGNENYGSTIALQNGTNKSFRWNWNGTSWQKGNSAFFFVADASNEDLELSPNDTESQSVALDGEVFLGLRGHSKFERRLIEGFRLGLFSTGFSLGSGHKSTTDNERLRDHFKTVCLVILINHLFGKLKSQVQAMEHVLNMPE